MMMNIPLLFFSENIIIYPDRLDETNNTFSVPFEINDSDLPLIETGPNIQLCPMDHYIQGTSCDYYFGKDSLSQKRLITGSPFLSRPH